MSLDIADAPSPRLPGRADPRESGRGPARPGSATPPLRILFLDHTASLGGGEIALFNLVTTLDPSRFTPIVMLFAEGPLADKLRAAGIDTRILPLDASVGSARKDDLGASSLLKFRQVAASIGFVRRLARAIRQLRPDLVHTNSLKSDLLGGLAARLARIPCIWHVRDRITPEYLPGKVALLFRRAARILPTCVVAISQSTLDTLQLPPHILKNERKARIIHDGIPDPYAATGGPPPPPSAPLSTSANTQRLTVGIVGRITPWKGQHIFLQAAAEVLKRFPHTRFQIIGAALFAEQAYEQQLRDMVQSLRLESNVEFLGFRSDIPAVIAGLDILVHASTIGEPFGQVIVEGMIAERPVIATRGGGVPEITTPDTALLIPMNDSPALAAAIVQLLESETIRRQMATRARQHVLAHFTIQHTAAKVESLYLALQPVRPR